MIQHNQSAIKTFRFLQSLKMMYWLRLCLQLKTVLIMIFIILIIFHRVRLKFFLYLRWLAETCIKHALPAVRKDLELIDDKSSNIEIFANFTMSGAKHDLCSLIFAFPPIRIMCVQFILTSIKNTFLNFRFSILLPKSFTVSYFRILKEKKKSPNSC